MVEQGINRAFDTWGQALTAMGGKTRPANDADVSLNKLGYWTDNGAAYYYQMADSMTYEQTLAAVKSDFDQAGIPLGYLQLDSWFYPKGSGAEWTNNGAGIYRYEAAAPPFMSGLARFQQNLGVPLITHARWIDSSSPYHTLYKMSGNVVIDPAYWETVAGYLANSGVATFEQDWLDDKAHTDFNLTDGAAFLDNMAASMARRNLTMQYCMAAARHFLQSSKYSNLTTIRTSADHLERDRWTDFLYSSRLASALGAWPFTDNLLSTETSQLLLATLSAGPVGIGDQIGSINVREPSPLGETGWGDRQAGRAVDTHGRQLFEYGAQHGCCRRSHTPGRISASCVRITSSRLRRERMRRRSSAHRNSESTDRYTSTTTSPARAQLPRHRT